jgi:energy-coupling factor transport system permease protein
MRLADATVKPQTGLAQIDPRTRLLSAIGMAAAVTMAQGWYDLSMLILVIAFFYRWAGVSWQAAYRFLRPFFWLALIALLLTKGETGVTLVQVGRWRYTSGDATVGLWTAVRLILLVSSAVWLTITTSATALAAALRSMLHPLKRIGIPVESFSLAVLIAMRFFPNLAGEVRRIRRAQIARGVDWTQGWRGVWRRTISLIIPVFNAGIRRADQLADALVVRGYFHSTYPLERLTPLGSRDYALLTGVALILGITWLI